MVEFKEVKKAFKSREILRGVNLKIERGKTTVIFGVSGGGKSTIIKHIVGLLEADSGEIVVDGDVVDVHNKEIMRRIRRKVGFLFQNGALFDSMNIQENVEFALIEHFDMTPAQRQERVAELLKMVGLDYKVVAKLFPDELSGGMRKRVGLARTLALEPEVILYDEPTSGLDPVTSDLITQMIRKLQNELGVTSVLISHDIKESFKSGDLFAFLFEGKIIEYGDEEYMRNTPNPVVQQFLHSKSQGPIGFDF